MDFKLWRNIILLVGWIAAGAVVLFSGSVSRTQYALVWVCYVLELVYNVILALEQRRK